MNTATSVKITLAALLLGLGPGSALAGIILNISVDTSGLPVLPGSEAVFVLTDGNGTGDGNNTATLNNFILGGGSAGTVDPASMGGYSGGMGSQVSLTDSTFLDLFGQYFTAGTNFSFTLDLTTNVDTGGTPDEFSFYIYDPSTNPVAATGDPTGLDSLLTIDIDSSTIPATNNYDTSLVTATPVTPTPEPSSLLLLAAGFCSLMYICYRRRAFGV